MLTFEQIAPTLTGVLVSGIWAWLAQRGRQAFEQRMAAEGRVAEAALEALKAELTFNAEVRRQVAAARVRAVGLLVEKGVQILECVGNVTRPHPDEHEEALDKFPQLRAEFLAIFGQSKHLFPHTVVDEFSEYIREILDAWSVAKRNMTQDAFGSAYDHIRTVSEKMFKFARKQIGVDESSTDGRGN
jgi:hypothetical protein